MHSTIALPASLLHLIDLHQVLLQWLFQSTLNLQKALKTEIEIENKRMPAQSEQKDWEVMLKWFSSNNKDVLVHHPQTVTPLYFLLPVLMF